VYQREVSGSSEIYAALAVKKRNFGTPELVNATTSANQTYPVIAMARAYDDNYLAHSSTDVFAQRRLVVWQSENQDGSEWGIVGRMHGVVSEAKYPWYAADRYNESIDGLLVIEPELIPVERVVAQWMSDGLHLWWPPQRSASQKVFYAIYSSSEYDGEYVQADATSEREWIDRQAAERQFYRVFMIRE
jgi:hypothetical protein